jgi:fumarate reductase subunit D
MPCTRRKGVHWATGIGLSRGFMSYERAAAFVRNPLGGAVMFAVIVLSLWHGAERIYLTLRDMGLSAAAALRWLCYGAAGVLSVVAFVALAAART